MKQKAPIHRTRVALLVAGAMSLGFAGVASAHPDQRGPKRIVRDHRATKPIVRDHRKPRLRIRHGRPLTIAPFTLVRAQWGAATAAAQTAAAAAPNKRHRRGAKWKARYDRDGDGVLSPAERRQMRRAKFAKLDADGDGLLTKRELAAAKKQMRARKGKRFGKRKHFRNGKGKRSGAKQFSNRGRGRTFENLDANGDGVITQREFVNAVPHWRRQRDPRK